MNEANLPIEAVIWRKGRWFLLHNASAHSAITVKYFLANCRMVNASWLFPFPKLKLPYKKEDSRMLRMSTRTHLFCATLGQDIKYTLQSRGIILKENKRHFLSFHALCASYRLRPGTLQLDSVTPQRSDIYHIRLAYWMECPTALSLRRTAHINLHSRQQR